MNSPPVESDSDDTNPILVFGEDHDDKSEDVGLTLCSKQPSFRDISKHIPRGYNSMKDIPRKTIEKPIVPANRSQMTAQEQMRLRNSTKWEKLGYDPRYGKGDSHRSIMLYSFEPKLLREIFSNSDSRSDQSKGNLYNSHSVGLSLRRMDSVVSGRYGSGIVDTSKLDAHTWSLIHRKSTKKTETQINEADMNIDMLNQFLVPSKIDVCRELTKYDEDFTGDDSLIPGALKQMITHPKTSIVYRVLCGQPVSHLPSDDVERIIEEIRAYIDIALSKNLLVECDYLDNILDSLMSCLNAPDDREAELQRRLDEASAEYEIAKRNLAEEQFDSPQELLTAQAELGELVAAKKYDESVTLAKKIVQLKQAVAEQDAIRYAAASEQLEKQYKQRVNQIRSEYQDVKKKLPSRY